jgi:very-short-patch-repair endonuclease
VSIRIRLQYSGTCVDCGTFLPVGVEGRWTPGTREVRCIQCPRTLSTPATPPAPPSASTVPTAATTSTATVLPRTTEPPSADRVVDLLWAKLVGYHLACEERSSAAEPALFASSAWTVLPLDVESVVCGVADELDNSDVFGNFVARPDPNHSLYYGWPLAVVADRRRKRRVAPLLMTPVEQDEDGVATAREDAYPNPGLVNAEFFAPDAVAAVHALTVSGVPVGDAVAMAALVVRMAEVLGLSGRELLDPSALAADIDPGTRAPTVCNVAGMFHGPSDLATRSLLEELRALRRVRVEGTAAAHLLQDRIGPVEDTTAVVHGPLLLNDAQEQAVVASLTQPVTVVTGPPGTGKSQLVAAIVANAWVRGERVLVASTNNGAVDVATRRATDIDSGLLVRTGNKEEREKLGPVLVQLAERSADVEVSPALLARQFEAATARRSDVHRRLEARSATEARLEQLTQDLEAHRRLLWGRTPPPPLDAEGRGQLERRARRAVRARLLAARRRRRVLAAAGVKDGVSIDDVLAWAQAQGEWDRLVVEASGFGPRDGDADAELLAEVDDEWQAASLALVRASVTRALTADGGRGRLKQLAEARLTGPARVRSTAEALKTARGWACTALSAAPNFPLEPALFDVVVIDEASQCSIAHVLPLAYRARRLVVVGDPNQLTPVEKLDHSQLDALATAAGTTHDELHTRALSRGDDSAYTAYAHRAGDRVHLLDEHYRCHPSIARFCNQAFYGGQLRVLTDVNDLAGHERGLQWVHVQGRTQRGPNGGAFNEIEAHAVVQWVAERLDDGATIGVVTPFTAQTALIESLLSRAVPEVARHRVDLTVGTAHRFQGDERDLMVFSPVISDEAYEGTARWVEQQRNLLNVAVSRARSALAVVGDETAPSRYRVPTLAALRAAATGMGIDSATAEGAGAVHSEAERRLLDALGDAGLPVVAKPVEEGYELDFAVVEGAVRLDIECDGTQHVDRRGRRRRQDLARDAVLRRAGWHVLRIPAWRCLSGPDEAAAEVAARWRELIVGP